MIYLNDDIFTILVYQDSSSTLWCSFNSFSSLGIKDFFILSSSFPDDSTASNLMVDRNFMVTGPRSPDMVWFSNTN